MKCTDCSNEVRPVVAIDIDGTLGDYHGHFQEFAEAYLGSAPRAPYKGLTTHGRWFCDTYGVDLRTFREIKLAYRQGGMKRSMPAYKGAGSFVAALRELRAEVWITTTRPYLRLDNVDPDTRTWLSRHKIEYDGLLYDEDKYSKLAEAVDRERVVAVLDDLPEMIQSAEDLFGPVGILRKNGYNTRTHRIMVDSLDVALIIIGNYIMDWERRHG